MNNGFLELILPVYCIILFGFLLKKRGDYTASVDSFLNRTAFNFMLPAVILKGIVYTGIVPGYSVLIMTAFFLFSLAAVTFISYLIKEDHDFVLSSVRGNIVYFGIPVLSLVLSGRDYLYGTLCISILSPVVVTSVSLLGKGNKKLIALIVNPFTAALSAGMIMRFCSFSPEILKVLLERFTAPLFFISLIIIGGNLSMPAFRKISFTEGIPVVLKLFLLPAAFYLAAVFTGIENEGLKTGMVLFSAPAAVTNYSIAKELGISTERIPGNVMITTFLYFLYLPLLVKMISML